MGEQIITHDEAMEIANESVIKHSDAWIRLRWYIDQQQRTRPPHGEVRVVRRIPDDDMMAIQAELRHMKNHPRQSLAIVEPSTGVTVARDVLEKVREALTEAVANLCDGGPGCCEPARARALAEAALALLNDSTHA